MSQAATAASGDRAHQSGGAVPSTEGGEAEASSRPATALTHEWIWLAIDTIAARHGLSPSALARRAGLDPTTFNRSKRTTGEGRPRWPSTESISKVLEATGTTLDEFASLEIKPTGRSATAGPSLAEIPLLGHVRQGSVPDWPATARVGQDVAATRGSAEVDVFALDVADASLEPVYSRGHRLIVSASEIAQPGDRVVVKPAGAQPLPRLLIAGNDARVELDSFGTPRERSDLTRASIDWIARIISARY
jgi:phage repressor protein C with HTH and peptisase S24 domain